MSIARLLLAFTALCPVLAFAQTAGPMLIQNNAANVRDFGADPTGVADSTAAFVAAIAGGTGNAVSVPPGTYKLLSTVTAPNGVAWEFDGTLFTGGGSISSANDWTAWQAPILHGWLGSTNRSGNSFGLVNQYEINVTGATSSYEKDSAYFTAVTSDPSTYTQVGIVDGVVPTWGSPSVTKDAVGADLRGQINAGNLSGRAWGINAVVSAQNGGDGLLSGIEIDMDNHAASVGFNGAPNGNQPYLDQPNSKNGLSVLARGTEPSTSAILVEASGTSWHNGIVIRQGAVTDSALRIVATDHLLPAYDLLNISPSGDVLAHSIDTTSVNAPGGVVSIAVTGVSDYWLPAGPSLSGFPQPTFATPVTGTQALAHTATMIFIHQNVSFQVGGYYVPTNPGSGCHVGDILYLVGGTYTTPARVNVATIGSGGTVTGLSGNSQGSGYTALPAEPVTLTGGYCTVPPTLSNILWSVNTVAVDASGSGYPLAPTPTWPPANSVTPTTSIVLSGSLTINAGGAAIRLSSSGVGVTGSLTAPSLALTGSVAQSSVLAGPSGAAGAPTQRVLGVADVTGAAPLASPTFTGTVAAPSLSTTVDNQSTPSITVGSGAASTNYMSFSGGRAMFGLNGGGYANVTAGLGKGFEVYVNGTNGTVVTGTDALSISSFGNTTFGGTVTIPTIITPLSTPASSSAPCTAGQIGADANYVYVCTATNTWKRAALSGF